MKKIIKSSVVQPARRYKKSLKNMARDMLYKQDPESAGAISEMFLYDATPFIKRIQRLVRRRQSAKKRTKRKFGMLPVFNKLNRAVKLSTYDADFD